MVIPFLVRIRMAEEVLKYLFGIAGGEEEGRPDWQVTRVLFQIPNHVEFLVNLDAVAAIVFTLKVRGNIHFGDHRVGRVHSANN